MTPDDKRRLAAIRKNIARVPAISFLLRLLDEVIAERDAAINELSLWAADEVMLDLQAERDRYMRERDAAMAALRPFAMAADDLEKTRDNSEIWEMPAAMGIEAKDLRNAKAVLAAHSAATKPEETK